MFSRTIRTLAANAIVAFPLLAAAADTPATIPAAVQGTWSMTFYKGSSTSTTSPVAAGKVSTIIVGTNNQLCVDGVLMSNPIFRNNNSYEAIWTSGNYEFALSPLTELSSSGNEVNLNDVAAPKTWHGQWRGTRSSTSTSVANCTAGSFSGSASTTSTTTTIPTLSSDAQSVFDLAAEVFPSLFTNGSALGSYQGYVYKYFADSKIFVGIKDNAIWVMGGQYGNSPSNKGSISSVLSSLQTAKINIAKAQVAAIPTGNYTLTISGNYKATISGFAISTPLSLTLTNMPAPSTSDTNAIAQLVQTSFTSATGIANLKTTVINNTASRITFRVECTATLAGVGNVTYDLTYDYTR